MKDFSKFLGCESPEEKRQRTLAEKLAAEAEYAKARRFESSIFGQVETEAIRKRRSELRHTRQSAYDQMHDAQDAYRFAEKITREESATPPPRYRPELDRRDGSWTKR
jgi:hypothetical protein